MPPHRYRSVSVSDLICIRLFCGLRKCGNEGKRASSRWGSRQALPPPLSLPSPNSKVALAPGCVRFGLSHARRNRPTQIFILAIKSNGSENTCNLVGPPLFLCEIISYVLAGIPLVLVNAPFPTMTDQKSFCLGPCLSWLARSRYTIMHKAPEKKKRTKK